MTVITPVRIRDWAFFFFCFVYRQVQQLTSAAAALDLNSIPHIFFQSLCLSVCLSVCLFVCLSVCLSYVKVSVLRETFKIRSGAKSLSQENFPG